MYSLGVVCLLSAAVALPTPDQLRTNLQALPPPPEIKSEEKDINSNVLYVDDPNSLLHGKPDSEEANNPLESAEKPKAEDKDKLDDDIKVIQKESKESKESKDSKEKSKESKDSKEKSKESKDSKEKSKEYKESKESKEPWEFNKDIEERPEEQKEEKKEKDSKSEESKERNEKEVPIIVQVIKKPGHMGFISNWLPSIPNFHLRWPLSYFYSKFRNGGQQPIYIVRESDYAFDDY